MIACIQKRKSVLLRGVLVIGLMGVSGGCQVPPTRGGLDVRRETFVGYSAQEQPNVSGYDHRRAAGYRRWDGLSASVGLPGTRGNGEPNPIARRDPSLSGEVLSPFVAVPSRVNVSGFRPGEAVLCPYTNRRFIVPASAAVPLAEKLRESREASIGRASSTGRVRSQPETESGPGGESLSDEPGVVVRGDVSDEVPAIEKKPESEAMPYGTRVPGKPFHVHSPFTDETKIVDVAGMAPGTKVRCPYTGKLFLVPEE